MSTKNEIRGTNAHGYQKTKNGSVDKRTFNSACGCGGGTTTWSKERGSINGPGGRLHAINPQYRIDINWPRGSTIKTLRRCTASLRVIIAGLMPHRAGIPWNSAGNTPQNLVVPFMVPVWNDETRIQDDSRIHASKKKKK